MFVELEKAIGLAGVGLPFNINLTKDHRKLLCLLSDEISRACVQLQKAAVLVFQVCAFEFVSAEGFFYRFNNMLRDFLHSK